MRLHCHRSHIRALLGGIALVSLVGLLGGCAAPLDQGGVAISAPPAMPAAKMGLPPATRVFHDELDPYGDWVLIEPYGYVFRPDVNTVAWRPYDRGWWEPSDVFGWVWNSEEPFGWLTDHYGTWFYDDFQGWVWAPGAQWGPAWVAWVSVGDWIGWAPLAPLEYDRYPDIPGGVFVYASAAQFGRDDESMRATFVTGLARTSQPLQSIVRLGHADGVTFNRGPDPLFVQRVGGATVTRGEVRPTKLDLPRVADDDGTAMLLRSRRLFAQAEREWRGWRDEGVTPKPGAGGKPRPPVWRDPPVKKPQARPLGGPVLADSAQSHPAPRDSVNRKPVMPAPRDSVAGKVRGTKGGLPRKPGAKPDQGAAADSTR